MSSTQHFVDLCISTLKPVRYVVVLSSYVCLLYITNHSHYRVCLIPMTVSDISRTVHTSHNAHLKKYGKLYVCIMKHVQ